MQLGRHKSRVGSRAHNLCKPNRVTMIGKELDDTSDSEMESIDHPGECRTSWLFPSFADACFARATTSH